MRFQRVVAILLVLIACRFARATTWDEPWQESVARNTDTFIRARVIKCDKKQMTLKVLKHLAGIDVPESLVVDRFGMLHVKSISVPTHETDINFAEGEEWYFFLKKVDGAATWSLPTPTAGFAGVADGKVYATYRHSYHQALVPEAIYEPSMTAIFQFLHGQKYDEPYIHQLFQKYLTQPPMDQPKETGGELFFEQHVALECFYYFGKPDEYALLEPYLKSDGFHVQISAVRALSRIGTPAARQRLWDFLISDRDGFARVMAVWGLKRLDAREYLPKLKEFAPNAPEERTGFGGNIMDPRVGTRFPGSVKVACEQLIDEWSKPKPSTQAGKNAISNE